MRISERKFIYFPIHSSFYDSNGKKSRDPQLWRAGCFHYLIRLIKDMLTDIAFIQVFFNKTSETRDFSSK